MEKENIMPIDTIAMLLSIGAIFSVIKLINSVK